MTQFFDPGVAAHLQFFTLPMEAIGFALALIEVRFPRTAERLAGLLAAIAEPITRIRSESVSGPDDEPRSVLERNLSRLLTRVITVGVVIVALYYLMSAFARLLAGEATVDWALGQVIAFMATTVVTTIALVIMSLVAYFSLTAGSDLIQRFVAGRSVGTLGIVIAGIGVMGECYQLLTQLVLGT